MTFVSHPSTHLLWVAYSALLTSNSTRCENTIFTHFQQLFQNIEIYQKKLSQIHNNIVATGLLKIIPDFFSKNTKNPDKEK